MGQLIGACSRADTRRAAKAMRPPRTPSCWRVLQLNLPRRSSELQGCMKINALPKIAVCDTLSRAARVWSRSCAAWVSMRAGVDYNFDRSGVASLRLPANFPESHVDPAPGGSSFSL
jgi:hypothetical protein